nr:AAA family ATPase [Rhodoferax sp.]
MSVLYLDHFSLSTDPFRITPDTEFFFTGGQRGDILEGLIVAAMHDEGIISVVGEIGMGKTMLSRMLLERLRPLPADTVYLANPVFDRDEILGAIARDLMPEPPQGNRTQMLAALESVLIERYSQGRRVVVVIDEAHSMPGPTLEEIRLLSNLETTQHKLLKIVLFGQPELDELLDAPQLRQVKDRISHRFELQPLDAAEASAYLRFRLHKAGWQGGELFAVGALKLLVQASDGRTRKLNMLADKSMLAAYAQGVPQVGVEQVRRATSDGLPSKRTARVAGHETERPTSHWRKFAPMALGVLAALGVGYGVGYGSEHAWLNQVISFKSGGMPSRDKIEPPLASVQAPVAAVQPAVVSASAVPLAPAALVAAASTVRADGSGASPAPSANASQPVPVQKVTLAEPTLATKLRSNSLVARMRATDEFIALPSNNGFTVQLLSQQAPQEVEVLAVAQLIQAVLDGASAQAGASQSDVPVLVHNRLYQRQVFHVIYVGYFESRPAAMEFIESSPPALKRYKPVVRSLEDIRKEPAP